MKKIASLLLLPLLLAACGTQNAPQQIAHSAANGMQTGSGNESVAAFEAKVQNDLETLGLAGGLTSQGVVAGKSYLNVLKVNDSTARAYIKTTYPSSTGCTVDWGDGSVTTAQTPTPTNVSTEQQNHVYAKSGTYTIKLTCGMDAKTVKFAAKVAVTEPKGLFDTLTFTNNYGFVSANMKYSYRNYGNPGDNNREKTADNGLIFESGPNQYLLENNDINIVATGHKALAMWTALDPIIKPEKGNTFDVTSITAGVWGEFNSSDALFTAYGLDGGIIGTVNFSNYSGLGHSAVTKDVAWSGVSNIKITSEGIYSTTFYIDDMSFNIR